MLSQRNIAILKLKESVTFTDYIQPICLPEECEEPPYDATIYVAGWGRGKSFVSSLVQPNVLKTNVYSVLTLKKKTIKIFSISGSDNHCCRVELKRKED